MHDTITVKKVSNGFVVSWIKFLEKDERIDSQATRAINAVAKNHEELLLMIEMAASDVDILVQKNISGAIYKDK